MIIANQKNKIDMKRVKEINFSETFHYFKDNGILPWQKYREKEAINIIIACDYFDKFLNGAIKGNIPE